MKRLPLNDLPKHWPWTAYLLDQTGEPPSKPEAFTQSETYESIHADLLEGFLEAPVDAETFVRRIRKRGRPDPSPISIGGDLYLVSPDRLVDREAAAVRTSLAPVADDADFVVDLGCGYGATLGTIAETCPDATVVGGEYTESGIELAQNLYADDDRIRVESFDFHKEWDLLDLAGDVVVFTRGSLTTLKNVEPIVDRFADLAADCRIVAGVHLEQVDVHSETVLGLLRRRYSRVRGYNDGVLDSFNRCQKLEVTSVDYDVFGANPLHPLTLFRWRPT